MRTVYQPVLEVIAQEGRPWISPGTIADFLPRGTNVAWLLEKALAEGCVERAEDDDPDDEFLAGDYRLTSLGRSYVWK
jgi:hypothetical protein